MSVFSKELCFSLKPLLRLAGLMSPAELDGVCSSFGIFVWPWKPNTLLQPAQGHHIPAVPRPWKWNSLSPGAIPDRSEPPLILYQRIWTLSQIQLFLLIRGDPLNVFFFKQQLNSALWVEKEVCENMAYGCLPENCASCLLREIVMCSWHSL